MKTVKVADLIDNTSTIVKHDLNFAVLYLKEKGAALEVLKSADAELWRSAHDQIGTATAGLDNGAAGAKPL